MKRMGLMLRGFTELVAVLPPASGLKSKLQLLRRLTRLSKAHTEADGLRIPNLLRGILPLFPLDPYVVAPLVMMAPVEGDQLDPSVEADYRAAMEKAGVAVDIAIERIERFAFYERVRSNFAVVVTGEMAKYGNIILTKGLVQD